METLPESTHQEKPSIDDLVKQTRRGFLSRRQLLGALGAAGLSVAAASLLAQAASRPEAKPPVITAQPTPQEQNNMDLHVQHLVRQQRVPGVSPTSTAPPDQTLHAGEVHIQNILKDYHPDAVVEDPLAGIAIVGHQAIAARKRAEMASMRGLQIAVTNRTAVGEQVVAEWTATGEHKGAFLGFPASNRQFMVRGLTVVTRRDGYIVRESLYYDIDDAKRQLTL